MKKVVIIDLVFRHSFIPFEGRAKVRKVQVWTHNVESLLSKEFVPDLIVLEPNRGGNPINGLHILDQIKRSAFRDTPVVVLSGLAEQVKEEALKRGATAVMAKSSSLTAEEIYGAAGISTD